MADNRAVIVTGIILLSCWLVMYNYQMEIFERNPFPKVENLNFLGLLMPKSKENPSSQSAPSGDLEAMNNNFPFTNLNNSYGKIGTKLWNSLDPAFTCPNESLSRVGLGYGGKYVCGLSHFGEYLEQNPNVPCNVYSFGVKYESSFEAEVVSTTRCSVYSYDPTVDNIAKHVDVSNPRVHFLKMGIGGSNTQNVSTLKTLMQKNGGHEWIDLLKMDVEGYEHESFDTIFQDFEQLPIGQFMVELHFTRENRTEAMTDRILQLIENLEIRGLRMFSKEINDKVPEYCSEFSFINIMTLDRFLDVEQR